MAKPTPETLCALYDRALDEEIGICVTVTHPKIFRHDLDAAIRASGDPRYRDIITFIPNIPDTVFIAKKSTELEP